MACGYLYDLKDLSKIISFIPMYVPEINNLFLFLGLQHIMKFMFLVVKNFEIEILFQMNNSETCFP